MSRSGTGPGPAYVLTDQAYALSITHYSKGAPKEDRLRYYMGIALLLWVNWQVTTLLGALVGQPDPRVDPPRLHHPALLPGPDRPVGHGPSDGGRRRRRWGGRR